MEYRVDRQDGKAGVTFSGSVTIEQGNEMKSLMVGLLNDSQQVALDFAQADTIDLACLQTLCSAHRTAVGMNKELSMNPNLSAAFMKAVEAAGFVRHTGCKLDRTDACLWVEKYRREQ